MKSIKVQLPDQVYRQIEQLVEDGWFKSREDMVELAVRKFLASFRPDLIAKSIREDVEWGLRGGQ
jgi:Arc/MetJ-type ribon-helix-helix transcriptional regulator